MKEEIFNRVKTILIDKFDRDESELTNDTSFVNDLNFDSLDQVEFVMALEDEFDLNIPDEQAEKIQTMGQAVESIEHFLTEGTQAG